MKIIDIIAEAEQFRIVADEKMDGEYRIVFTLPVCEIEKGSVTIRAENGILYIPRYKDGYDRLYVRFDIYKQEEAISGVKFVTGCQGIWEWEYEYPVFSTKKALECTPEDAKNLGVKQSMANINLPALMTVTPSDNTIEYIHNGKLYYFIKNRVEELDQKFHALNEAGVLVTAILLNAPVLFESQKEEALLKKVIHPAYAWNQKEVYISAFNMCSEEGQDYFRAFVEFLAERYSREDAKYGKICGFVISNEVDSQYIWTNAGEMPVEAFTAEYTVTMRNAWLAAVKHYKNFRVYCSLDHFWTLSMEYGKQPLRYYSSREVLEYINHYAKEEGDFNWNIAHHPYPEDLRYPDFYHDRTAEFHFETPRITFKNIEILPAYLKQERFLYQGKERRIILSEQGFNSNGTVYSEKQGAAAYCLAYEKVKKLPTIDLMTHHAYADNLHEFGLNLGVRRRNPDGSIGDPKPIYDMIKDMDTETEIQRIEETQNFIGKELFDEILNPVIICGKPEEEEIIFG